MKIDHLEDYGVADLALRSLQSIGKKINGGDFPHHTKKKGKRKMVEVIENGNKVELYTPYSKDFVTEIKSIGGSRWDASKKCWTIPKDALDFAKDAMLRIYGDNGDKKQATLTVKLTFEETKYSKNREAYTLMGKTVARATGRNSGAYPCEDSIFEAGKPESGGSKVNWYTVIPSGSIVRLSNVSSTLWKEFCESNHEGIVAEIVEDKIDVDALKAEREKLMSRIQEIDELLKKCESTI